MFGMIAEHLLDNHVITAEPRSERKISIRHLCQLVQPAEIVAGVVLAVEIFSVSDICHVSFLCLNLIPHRAVPSYTTTELI